VRGGEKIRKGREELKEGERGEKEERGGGWTLLLKKLS
jgi:hypothetical protein